MASLRSSLSLLLSIHPSQKIFTYHYCTLLEICLCIHIMCDDDDDGDNGEDDDDDYGEEDNDGDDKEDDDDCEGDYDGKEDGKNDDIEEEDDDQRLNSQAVTTVGRRWSSEGFLACNYYLMALEDPR